MIRFSGDSFSENEKFVSWFRQAWPYIRGHRGSIFVVVISGEIVDSPHLDSILQVLIFFPGYVIVGGWPELGKLGRIACFCKQGLNSRYIVISRHFIL